MTMPLMTIAMIEDVIDCWIRETELLSQKFTWVQLFENRGELMGCSNAHPHCQIWASSFLPNEARREDEQQQLYFQKHQRLLLQDYVQQEMLVPADQSRIVVQNEHWLVVVSTVMLTGS